MRPRAPLLRIWGDPLGPAAGERWGTLSFLLVVFVAVFWDLGGRSLHNLDLPRFGRIAHEMLTSGSWLVPTQFGQTYVNKPPLYPWLIALPSWVFGGITPLLVRLPSALGLLGMVLWTSAWGRLRTGSLAAGRAAALLLLGTFLVTRLGRESRPDMLAAGLATGTAFVLDRLALGRGRKHDVLWAGVLAGLAMLAKGPPALAPAAVVVLLPDGTTTWRERVRRAHVWRVLGLAVGLCLLWLVPAVLQGGVDYADRLVVDQVRDRVTGQGNKLEPWWYYAVRFLDAGLPWTPLYVGVVLLALTARGRSALGAGRSLALAALLVLMAFSFVPTKQIRYVVAIFPFVSLGIGAGLAIRGERPAAAGWQRALAVSRPVLVCTAAVALGLAFFVPGALVLIPLPTLLLVLLAVAPGGAGDPVEARRLFVGRTLVAVALLVSAAWTLRDRRHEREGDRFQRVVAEQRAEVAPPLVVLSPLVPDRVFPTVPNASPATLPTDLPDARTVPRLDVLAAEEDQAAIEAHRGEKARVLLTWPYRERGGRILLLRFGAE